MFTLTKRETEISRIFSKWYDSFEFRIRLASKSRGRN